MAEKRPFFVLVPGAGQNPTHYGLLSHFLHLSGYPVFSALLPSIGATGKVTIQDDARYIRDNMVIPILDHAQHDVILVMHSYSSVPGSAAARGLSKSERLKQGKKTGIVGQICIAALLLMGGDGTDILGAFSGEYPPHIRPEPEANLLHCDDRIPSLYNDVPETLADSAAASALPQGMTSFTSALPRATWDDNAYKGRIAFIRTLKDAAVPLPMQQQMIEGTGAGWIVKDIDSGHSPQLSQPEKLTGMLVELAKEFEVL